MVAAHGSLCSTPRRATCTGTPSAGAEAVDEEPRHVTVHEPAPLGVTSMGTCMYMRQGHPHLRLPFASLI